VIESLDDRHDRTLIIEEQAQPGWNLVEPAKAKEQTADAAGLLRFEVRVDRKGKASHKVVQQQVTGESVGVMSVTADTLAYYAQSGKLSPKVREAWEKAQQLQANISAANAEAQRVEQEKGEITSDQNRVRQNMQTIDRASELYQRLMTKLSQQETRMEELAKAAGEARAKVAAAEKALNDYLGALNLD
jgi:predicted  nucleic acid-binding Zn-ribbon protein